MAKNIHFKKVAIIGVGLIGGSIAKVLRQKGLADAIVGIGRGIENLSAAKSLGVIDNLSHEVGVGVLDADLVIVAVPVMKIAETIGNALPYLKPGCIITDVGSVKKSVIDEIDPVMPQGIHFVPGHPIAGTENSGVVYSVEDLFVDRKCILTPTDRTNKEALSTVEAMWEAAGSKVVMMDAAVHDRVLAAVSHLPHMIAYSLVNTVADIEEGGVDVLSYSAGGFRDFTRIASSSPEMWSDICMMNKESIVRMIDVFQTRLAGLKKLIEAGEIDALKNDFSRAKDVRDSLADRTAGKDTPEGR